MDTYISGTTIKVSKEMTRVWYFGVLRERHTEDLHWHFVSSPCCGYINVYFITLARQKIHFEIHRTFTQGGLQLRTTLQPSTEAAIVQGTSTEKINFCGKAGTHSAEHEDSQVFNTLHQGFLQWNMENRSILSYAVAK